jgi:hypothetical protein
MDLGKTISMDLESEKTSIHSIQSRFCRRIWAKLMLECAPEGSEVKLVVSFKPSSKKATSGMLEIRDESTGYDIRFIVLDCESRWDLPEFVSSEINAKHNLDNQAVKVQSTDQN